MDQKNVVTLRAVKQGDAGIRLEFADHNGDIGKFFAAQADGSELPLEYVEAIIRFYLTNNNQGQGVDLEQHAKVTARW